ncbi:hypothetical protein L0F63_000833 [Massospora cicadina]|nr:hypothetical protein L0F63_000833 [Massospora cicadina]
MVWKPPTAPKCHVCEKNVYHVEQVIGPGGFVYHDSCFKCSTCNKRLDSTSLAEKNNTIYCKSCYGKQFGPKGYGFAGGSSFLTTGIYSEASGSEYKFELKQNSRSTSPSSSLTSPTHQSGFLSDSGPHLLPNYAEPGLETESSLITKAQPLATRSLSSNPIENTFVAPNPRRFYVEQEKCLRCKKSVYAAEMVSINCLLKAREILITVQVIGCGGKYHQSCFRCIDCSKSLNSSNLTEHAGELYCKGCYSREFGPKPDP